MTLRIGQRLAGWVFLTPALFFFVAYQVYPIVRTVWLSFTNHAVLSGSPEQWVGFGNYAEALSDPLLWAGLGRAAWFTLMFLPGTIVLPLLLAVLISRVTSGWLAAFYRFVLLIPAFLPSTLIFVLWKWMFNFQAGPINHVLVENLGWFSLSDAPQWLGGTRLTLPAVVVAEIWWGLGYHTIFFLAGLAVIPEELCEAARLDGASEWRVFRHILWPGLQPIILVLIVLRFGTAMAVLDEFLIFGSFSRVSPTYSWTVLMYDLAFKSGVWRQGYAAAIGLIGAITMMLSMLLLVRTFRLKEE